MAQHPTSAGELPVSEQLTIRFNQLVDLFDRFPLATALCYTDGFVISGANPGFSKAVGIGRSRLPGRALFDILSPTDATAADQLTAALQGKKRGRFPLQVRWTAKDVDITGHLTAEPVDWVLIGHQPVLVFLHVDQHGPAPNPQLVLEPVAARILMLVAGGATTAVVARNVGLTVDGVNYHLRRLSRLLHAPNRPALVARAYALGLLQPGTWPPTAAGESTVK
jgi:DNA-binding CsgD family transcriptional regulator